MIDKTFIQIILLMSLSNLNGNNSGSHKMQIELTPDRLRFICSEPSFLKEPVMKTKICSQCKKEKVLSDFYFRVDQNKYRANCKKCCCNQKYEYVDEDREKFNKRIYLYRMRNIEKTREREKIKAAKFRLKYPLKYKARIKISTLIRAGKLKQQSCEVCGIFPTQAHHEDYNKPLEVKWLCLKHHAMLHREKNKKRRAK